MTNKEIKDKKESKKNKEDIYLTSNADGNLKGSSKSQIVVALRNKFFNILYKYSNIVFLSSLITFILSVIFSVLFAKQPVPPQYIPINEDGTYIKLLPLDQCKTDAEVQEFVLSAMKKLYKYDYINFSEQIQEAAYFFSPEGWNEYLTKYKETSTLAAVKENKWIVTLEINSAPEIIQKNIVNSTCVYDLKSPITISYIGQKSQSQKGIIYIRMGRTSVINNPEGLAIQKLIFKEDSKN